MKLRERVVRQSGNGGSGGEAYAAWVLGDSSVSTSLIIISNKMPYIIKLISHINIIENINIQYPDLNDAIFCMVPNSIFVNFFFSSVMATDFISKR